MRWPLYASGRLVGTMVGWSVVLSVGGTAAEISAIMQYAAHYLPGSTTAAASPSRASAWPSR